MGGWAKLLSKLKDDLFGEKSVIITYTPADLPSHYWPANLDTTTGALQNIIIKNELVFACLAAKATAAQDPMLRVERQVTRQGRQVYEPVAGHPFRQLMIRPNPMMSEADLMQAALISWDASNPRRFFCEKIYRAGVLAELHPLNPACMRPRYSRANSREIIGYDWIDGRDKKEYSLDDLLIRAAPVWYDPPPLPAALGSVTSDTSQTDYISAFFENGGVPSGFLKYKNTALNDEKRDEIRNRWRSIYGNKNRGQHDVGVLDMHADWMRSGANLDELSSDVLRQVAESRICMVFGVPPLIVYAYVGLVRATYSNLKEAWRGFWDATMSPAFKEWRDFWTWSLLTEFEDERAIRSEQLRLNYDMSQVAALQEDVTEMQERARLNFQAGGITLNEYRSAIGQAADPVGDYYVRSPVAAPLPAGVALDMIPTGQLAAPPKGRKGRADPSVRATERRMASAIESYLKAEYRKAAQAVRG